MTNQETHFETRFQLKDLIHCLLGSLGLYLIFFLILSQAKGIGNLLTIWPNVVQFLISYFLQFTVMFAPLWIVVVNRYQSRWEDFGFRSVPLKKWGGAILSNYLLYLFVSLLMVGLMQWSGESLPGYGQQESYLPLFGTDALGLSIGLIVVVIFAPVLEEWYFRGFLDPILRKNMGEKSSSLFSAGLFAAAHFQWGNILPLLLLGLLLNRAARQTESIWTSIGLHSLNNGLAFGLQIYLALNPELIKNLELGMDLIYTVKIGL